MTEYQMEAKLANFLRKEIAKEIKRARSLHFPVDISVERIFQLVATAAHHAIPKRYTTPPPTKNIELN